MEKLANLLQANKLLIIKTDGTIEYRKPNGKTFSLNELQDTVRMDDYPQDYALIEIAPTRVQGYKVIVNEEGLLMGMPLNRYADQVLREFKGQTMYAGNVVIVPNKLF